jgi:Transglycosylase SLT domain.
MQPQMARFFNLVVDSDLDERTDPEKATQAVAKYFEEQLARFGKKHGLVFCIAVYGSGEGRVAGALRKVEDAVHSKDFWYAYRMGYFDQATSDYVARVAALMILGENPQEFGLVAGRRSQP